MVLPFFWFTPSSQFRRLSPTSGKPVFLASYCIGSAARPLRANIHGTVLVLVINEQGEKEEGRDER